MDGQRRKEHPELHHSRTTKEDPEAAGPCMGPWIHKHQETDMRSVLAAPYKVSSGRREHLIKWIDSRIKWKTRSSIRFFMP